MNRLAQAALRINPIQFRLDLRHSSGDYVLTYRWEGSGLFGGHSLHLVSLSRG